MQRKTSWNDAIKIRTSRRTYTKEPLGQIELEKIESIIKEANEESGMNFQLIGIGGDFFNGFKASYGMIKGAASVIALVGPKTNEKETQVKIGYYAQFIMLECVELGLGTCWIGGTYNKKSTVAQLQINEDEALYSIISVGYVHAEKSLKEKIISQTGKNKQSFDELLIEKQGELPQWVIAGIESARLAPSGVNNKPVTYSYTNDQLKAILSKHKADTRYLDLGISLAQFEIGALSAGYIGRWTEGETSDEYLFI